MLLYALHEGIAAVVVLSYRCLALVADLDHTGTRWNPMLLNQLFKSLIGFSFVFARLSVAEVAEEMWTALQMNLTLPVREELLAVFAAKL